MGRRKKEPRSVHRENIAAAAAGLFMEKVISQTSMDDIAKAISESITENTDRIKLEQNWHNKEWRYRLLYGIMNFQP